VGRPVVRCVVAALVAACLGIPALAEVVPPEEREAYLGPPTALVTETVGRVVEILQDGSLPTEERRKRIEKLAFDVFDFSTMGKLVLARNWKKLDDRQRREFIEQFKIYLSRNYGSRLDRYRQTDVAIVGARIEPRGDVTVLSEVVGGEFDGVALDYRLRRRGGDWKVIDVVIEGVSLIGNFRSQFREVVSQKGPEGLLEQMRVKNAEPRAAEDAAS
jgi:phospholipid transport system substrate-binding protein